MFDVKSTDELNWLKLVNKFVSLLFKMAAHRMQRYLDCAKNQLIRQFGLYIDLSNEIDNLVHVDVSGTSAVQIDEIMKTVWRCETNVF